MPVGESEKGVGAAKNQIIYGVQSFFSYIDWWHEPIGKENYDHKGTLNTFIIKPSLVYGLNKKLNLSLNTTIGIRSMHWGVGETSIHHRSENTLSKFKNAHSSIFGDSKLLLRYLFKNAGMNKGFRIFGAAGLNIPSKSVLTSDPFFLNDEPEQEHRHFSLSNGTYNYILESQFYYKRSLNPVFFGGFIQIENPIKESKYGFLSPRTINITLSAINKRFDSKDSSIGYGGSLLLTGKGYWNGKVSPNTESIVFSPSLTYLVGLKFGSMAINIQKPMFLSGSFAGNEGEIKQRINAWQVGLTFRIVPKMKN